MHISRDYLSLVYYIIFVKSIKLCTMIQDRHLLQDLKSCRAPCIVRPDRRCKCNCGGQVIVTQYGLDFFHDKCNGTTFKPPSVGIYCEFLQPFLFGTRCSCGKLWVSHI